MGPVEVPAEPRVPAKPDITMDPVKPAERAKALSQQRRPMRRRRMPETGRAQATKHRSPKHRSPMHRSPMRRSPKRRSRGRRTEAGSAQARRTEARCAQARCPKPDAPKPDAPKPDAPKPDAPKPDAPKPAKPKDNPFGRNNDVKTLRMWTDASGKYRIEARFVSFQDGKFVCRRPMAVTFALPTICCARSIRISCSIRTRACWPWNDER